MPNSTPTIIRGFGSYVPEDTVDNLHLSTKVDTSDEWIRSRTGIQERRFASLLPSNQRPRLKAAERAIADAKIDKKPNRSRSGCHRFTPDMAFLPRRVFCKISLA